VRRAEDSYVAELYAAVPGLGATLVEARFPRAYIDANRHVSDIDTELLSDAWPGPVTPSRKTEQGIGLVWRLAHGGVPLYARKLSAAEVTRRIVSCYDPYHAAVAAAIDHAHDGFGAVWHVNCHSMPAVGDVNADDAGRERADFVLGDRDGSTCEPAFTARVADHLRRRGYRVAINDPYKGVELVRKFGRPAEERHSLQIEINRRLYMNETTLEKHAGFDSLQNDVATLCSTLRDYVSQRIRPRRPGA
jgi:N-formylglutamate amidohydrolase